MESAEEKTKFEFVVSTPSHNASAEKNMQRFVRKHVMRKYKKHKSPPRTVLLEDEDLAAYLAQREQQGSIDEIRNDLLLLYSCML